MSKSKPGKVHGGQRPSETRAQARQLAARLESAVEEERKRLSRELHDELGQTLTAIKLELARTIELFDQFGLCPGGLDRLQSLSGLADIGLTTIKRIATDLRPGKKDRALAEAIRAEVAALGMRSGLRMHLACDCKRAKLTAEQEDALFRIVQESLTNVVRHADASTVRVRLIERNGVVELRVSDDGRGVTPAELQHPRSLGLLGMRERTVILGGRFAITGRPGKGTVVTVHVPLKTRRRARV